MKKFITMFCLMLVVIISVSACAEKPPKVIMESDTYIVLSTADSGFDIDGNQTLIDYMQYLKSKDELKFEVKDGMITSINEIDNPADFSSCWMLYTSDTENANDAWGNIDYNGTVYGSAVSAAGELKIKEDCLYIWVFQKF